MRKTITRTLAVLAMSAGALGLVGGVASADELTAPVVVPSHPSGSDYVNAFNESGALLVGGAAGVLSSVWAGAIPSIVEGALG